MTIGKTDIRLSGMQRRLVVTDFSVQHIIPKFKGQAWPFKMVLLGCPETSVFNYQSKLRNVPEERRSYLNRGHILKSRI